MFLARSAVVGRSVCLFYITRYRHVTFGDTLYVTGGTAAPPDMEGWGAGNIFYVIDTLLT